MTTRAAWKRRLAHATVLELLEARAVYSAYVDLYERLPELCSSELHENALTALREIDASLRRQGGT